MSFLGDKVEHGCVIVGHCILLLFGCIIMAIKTMSKDVDFYENLIYYGINEHTFALKGAFES